MLSSAQFNGHIGHVGCSRKPIPVERVTIAQARAAGGRTVIFGAVKIRIYSPTRRVSPDIILKVSVCNAVSRPEVIASPAIPVRGCRPLPARNLWRAHAASRPKKIEANYRRPYLPLELLKEFAPKVLRVAAPHTSGQPDLAAHRASTGTAGDVEPLQGNARQGK